MFFIEKIIYPFFLIYLYTSTAFASSDLPLTPSEGNINPLAAPSTVEMNSKKLTKVKDLTMNALINNIDDEIHKKEINDCVLDIIQNGEIRHFILLALNLSYLINQGGNAKLHPLFKPEKSILSTIFCCCYDSPDEDDALEDHLEKIKNLPPDIKILIFTSLLVNSDARRYSLIQEVAQFFIKDLEDEVSRKNFIQKLCEKHAKLLPKFIGYVSPLCEQITPSERLFIFDALARIEKKDIPIFLNSTSKILKKSNIQERINILKELSFMPRGLCNQDFSFELFRFDPSDFAMIIRIFSSFTNYQFTILKNPLKERYDHHKRNNTHDLESVLNREAIKLISDKGYADEENTNSIFTE